MFRNRKFNKGFIVMPLVLLISATAVFLLYAQDDEAEIVRGKWSYYKTPQLTSEEILKSARQAARQPKVYIEDMNKKILDFSKKLEQYIYQWIKGEVKGAFPKGFFSEWIDNERTHDWRLVKPDEITADEQWYALPSYDPDKELHQCSPDPNATYLKLIFLAPLDSKLLIEGDFPHARFMSYQIILPLDPLHPQEGMCEVPLVDVDIEPDAGHVNPFQVGADRNAQKRHYHIEFDLKAGDAVKLNPQAMVPPQYRAPGNRRVGGPFQINSFLGGNVIVPAVLWLRYYPDKKADPFGGVPLPKATLQMASGEKFWITCDKSLAVKLQTDPVPRISQTPPQEPYPFTGPSLGWMKMYDIMLSHMEAKGYYTTEPWGIKDINKTRKHIRQIFQLMFNRGVNATPPGNYETGPTCNNYNSYLIRPANLGKNKVIVLTGKLPTFPHTRNGEPTMTKGEVRLLSITHQLSSNSKYNKEHLGTPYGSLMDDEIITNENNEYIIVYSRKEEKPVNALSEYGVTWQNWGEPASQGFVLRWLSVMPDWHLPKYAPDQNNIPWKTGAWSQDTYDKNLVGNNYPGVMGPYHPEVHYLTKEEFEALGNKKLKIEDIPKWTDSKDTTSSSVDTQQKVKELRKAFSDLRQARLAKDKQGVTTAISRILVIWDELPPETRQAIETQSPGITEKIENLH